MQVGTLVLADPGIASVPDGTPSRVHCVVRCAPSLPNTASLPAGFVQHACEGCYEAKDVLLQLRCSRCKGSYYCGRKCQVAHWRHSHQWACEAYRRLGPAPVLNGPRMVLLSAIVMRRAHLDSEMRAELFRMSPGAGIHSKAAALPEGQAPTLSELIGSVLYTAGLNVASALGQDAARFAQHLLSANMANSFSITEGEEQRAVGVGWFMHGSRFNHSCTPNAVAMYHGPEMRVTLIRPVSAGEEVVIAYLDCLQRRSERLSMLRNTYAFDCACARCMTGSGKPAPDPELLERVDRVVKQARESTDRDAACAALSALLKQLARVGVDDQDPASISVLNELTVQLSNGMRWHDAAKTSERTLPAYWEAYSSKHPVYGLQLAQVGKYRSLCDDCEPGALPLLEEAMDILRLTFEPDSPTIANLKTTIATTKMALQHRMNRPR